jgi:L-rhamnose mutarotase
MILEVNDSFSSENKSELDSENLKVQEWEALMWKYQHALLAASKGEKWILMDKIYQL